ncbi:MAG: ABC transporter substrate-binding protein [Acidobacteria bacterium]|nr:ABC transporter substrate-binding protein [Acidobacteriota bacterium]
MFPLRASGAEPERPAPGPVRRIVALAPSAAEILFALGAADVVVGVSDFTDDLPEAKGKKRLGGFAPDLEGVVALAPDLVVVSKDGVDRAAYEKLVSLGLRVVVTDGSSIDGVLDDLRRVAGAAGLAGRGETIVSRLRERLAGLGARVRALGRGPRALLLVWPEPPVVAGPKTFVGDVLARAGFVNVVPERAGEWPRVSLETLASWKPDIVIRPETKENAEAFAALPRDPRWRLLPAVREGRILRVPGALLERPGPRLVDALEVLVEAREKTRADRP